MLLKQNHTLQVWWSGNYICRRYATLLLLTAVKGWRAIFLVFTGQLLAFFYSVNNILGHFRSKPLLDFSVALIGVTINVIKQWHNESLLDWFCCRLYTCCPLFAFHTKASQGSGIKCKQAIEGNFSRRGLCWFIKKIILKCLKSRKIRAPSDTFLLQG